MLHMRLRIVFVLLVLILLVVSILFGVLTYWLDAEEPPALDPGQESSSHMLLAAMAIGSSLKAAT
jgi:uncharacterized SAM-binding protein YcdF (DUF218 family)